MIAVLIFYSGKLMAKRMKLDVNNFFSFLAAMMLAYQPVRSLYRHFNYGNLTQGLSAASRILPIIDQKNIESKTAEAAKPISRSKMQKLSLIDVNFCLRREMKGSTLQVQ